MPPTTKFMTKTKALLVRTMGISGAFLFGFEVGISGNFTAGVEVGQYRVLVSMGVIVGYNDDRVLGANEGCNIGLTDGFTHDEFSLDW